MGTFNFAPPGQLLGIPHVVVDVLPYWALGNTPDDPVTLGGRIAGAD